MCNREEVSKSNNCPENLDRRLQLHRKRRKTKWLFVLLLVIVIMLLLLIICFAPLGVKQLVADKQAQKITGEVMTREELRQQLQEAADNSNFRVKLNTAPTSADGKTADWCIVNSADNSYDMQVTIRTESGWILYEGEKLSPGGELLVGPLQTELDNGSYEAVATVTALDRETQEEKGQITVDLTLTVQRL